MKRILLILAVLIVAGCQEDNTGFESNPGAVETEHTIVEFWDTCAPGRCVYYFELEDGTRCLSNRAQGGLDCDWKDEPVTDEESY